MVFEGLGCVLLFVGAGEDRAVLRRDELFQYLSLIIH